MARDIILGRVTRSYSRDRPAEEVGLDLGPATDYFRKHPLSYRAKTGILLAGGLLVLIFSRKRRD